MRTTASIVGVLFALPLLLGLPGCGGGESASPAAPSTPNQPPSGSFTVSPGNVALMSCTILTFSASGSDPENQALTYSWSFGDGNTASGQTVTHTYGTAGSFTATLTIQDSGGATGTSSETVTVKSIAGQWSDEDPRWTLEFTQNGPGFSGTVYFGPLGHISNIEGGVLSDPRNLTFFRRATHWWSYQDTYDGEFDQTLDRITARPRNQSCCTFTLTRK